MANRMLSTDLPALLTVEQVAKQLGISRARCYQLIGGSEGVQPEIPSIKVGRLRRVAATDLEQYLLTLAAIDNS